MKLEKAVMKKPDQKETHSLKNSKIEQKAKSQTEIALLKKEKRKKGKEREMNERT